MKGIAPCTATAVRAVFVVSLAVVASHASAAAPFAYDEAVHGDLPGGGPLPVFELGAGANTVAGTLGGGTAPDANFDGFAFTLAPGQTFLGGTFALADVPGTGNLAAAGWDLVTGSDYGAGDYIASYITGSPGSATIPAGVITVPGTYHLEHGFYGGDLGSLGAYTITLNAVPEPASVCLLGFAGAALLAPDAESCEGDATKNAKE